MKSYIGKNLQSGRSMIEMLGVLAIVGILSAGGIAGYSMAMQSYKTNQLIERMQLIATRTRQLYKGDYTNLNNTNLINSGKLAEKDLENPFGGVFTVRKSTSSTARFTIDTVDKNIPSEVCVDTITTYWGDEGVFVGLEVISTSTTHFKYNAPIDENKGYPITEANIGDVITACSGSDKRMKTVFK